MLGQALLALQEQLVEVPHLTHSQAQGLAAYPLLAALLPVGLKSYASAASIGGTFQTTNSDITFSQAVTLLSNLNITSGAGGGDINFNNTVDGAYDLTANAGTGDTNFLGNVGATTPLADLSFCRKCCND